MERCSISPVARVPAPRCLVPLLLLVALATRPSSCNPEDVEDADKEPTDAPSVQLSVTGQVTPTPLWAVDWGPTQQLEDETYHFLSSQETDALRPQVAGTEDWLYGDSSLQPAHKEDGQSLNQEGAEEKEVLEEEDQGMGAEETEPEEVDPQFYVTVTISTLLILTAVIITAKLCYDRSCSRHQPPLSRGGPPPLSLALPRSLASEDSRQTLHSTSSSFADRERIPVVNL